MGIGGKSVPALGSGSITLTDDQGHKHTIKNVLYVLKQRRKPRCKLTDQSYRGCLVGYHSSNVLQILGFRTQMLRQIRTISASKKPNFPAPQTSRTNLHYQQNDVAQPQRHPQMFPQCIHLERNLNKYLIKSSSHQNLRQSESTVFLNPHKYRTNVGLWSSAMFRCRQMDQRYESRNGLNYCKQNVDALLFTSRTKMHRHQVGLQDQIGRE